jgi:ribulose 1,5-bisphosphate carboxylase large subunit-like protein
LGLSAKNYGRAVYECLRGGLDFTKLTLTFMAEEGFIGIGESEEEAAEIGAFSYSHHQISDLRRRS